MSVSYVAVGWNKNKKIYDILLFSFCALFLGVFSFTSIFLHPYITQETIIIRATSTLAVLLLHIILAIGPLCRLDKRFLPLLYNRRHLGVTMFAFAAVHGIFSIIQFHSLGNVNPLVSVFISNRNYNSYVNFPFQSLGFFALVILLLMAVTSHDFWLNNLGPAVWKSLHMMVYVAYALIIFHVLLGVLELENSPVFFILITAGMLALISLHLLAGRKERKKDMEFEKHQGEFIEVCDWNDIEDKRAKVACINGERIAIFRYENKLSAVSNVCKHQNGPLGEGKIIDGCITCPWHGYQYQPQNGRAPEPFKEKLATYELKLEGRKVYVNPEPLPEGTFIEPLELNK